MIGAGKTAGGLKFGEVSLAASFSAVDAGEVDVDGWAEGGGGGGVTEANDRRGRAVGRRRVSAVRRVMDAMITSVLLCA